MPNLGSIEDFQEERDLQVKFEAEQGRMNLLLGCILGFVLGSFFTAMIFLF